MKIYTIIYKSGQKVQFRAENLVVKRYANGRLEVSWDKISPRPFLMGVDDIAAIWQGKV